MISQLSKMLTSSACYTNEILSKEEVNKICDSLKNEQLRMVCLRQCKVSDSGFKRIMKQCGTSKYLLQLTLNLGIVADQNRIELLGQALRKNKTLKGLLIHGNPIGDDGLKIVTEALSKNHNISSLDIGDCQLGDASIKYLKLLLNPEDETPGLTELTISGNVNITDHGWAVLAMCISTSPCLRSLYVDYNKLGDNGASCLLIAAAASQMIEVLDLEGTDLTEKTGKLVMELVQTYPGRLRKVSLVGNKVRKSTMAVINNILKSNADSDEVQETSEDDLWTASTDWTSETGTSTEASATKTSSTRSASGTESNSGSESSSSEKSSSGSSQTGTVKGSDKETAMSQNNEDKNVNKNSEEEKEDDSEEELKEVPVYW